MLNLWALIYCRSQKLAYTHWTSLCLLLSN